MSSRCLGFLTASHPTLGRAVFEQSGIAVGRVSAHRFADGEFHCVVESDVKGRAIFVFHSSIGPVHDSFMELLILCDALKRGGARRVIVVMPFVLYRRQEKQNRSGESITLRLVGELMQTGGVDELITVNLHRPETVKWLARQTLHVSVLDELVRAVGKTQTVDVVCAPDNGAIPLAQTAATELGATLMSVVKRRVGVDKVAFAPLHAGLVEQVRGKKVLVVDDEIDTGGTMLGVARLLRKAGAAGITLAAVHGVLSAKAVVNLGQVKYDKLFLTNTLPVKLRHFPRARVVSVAPALAEVVAKRAEWL